MYILASDQKSVIDSGYVQRFCLVGKPDATLIIASLYDEMNEADYTGRRNAERKFDCLLQALPDRAWVE